MSPDDIKQSMVPSDIVKSIMDMTDKSTAKELSSVEAAVTSLITKLNTPPRIEDIDREIEEVKEMTDKIPAIGKDVDELKRGTVQIPIIANSIDDVVRKVGGIISDIEKFRDIISKTTEKIDKIIDEANKNFKLFTDLVNDMISKTKFVMWIAGITAAIAISVITLITSIQKSSMETEFQKEIKIIEEKIASARRDESLMDKKLQEEIEKMSKLLDEQRKQLDEKK